MTAGDDDAPLSKAEEEAIQWLARLRARDRRDEAPFEEWYAASPENAEAYDRVLASWDRSARLRLPAAVSPYRRWAYLGVAAAIAAVLLLCLGLGVARSRWGPASDTPVEVVTRVGEIRTVVLADGTQVTLDTQSAIRTDFDAARRQVRLLRGRARFEVTAEARPFVVATASGSVSTIAASLDVAYFGRETQIALVRGQADFRDLRPHAPWIHVAPGTQLVAGHTGQAGSILRLAAADTRWTSGMLSFENAPLSAVIAAANRYSVRQISLADPALGALRFTGTFKATDTAALAQMVAAMFGLRCDASVPHRLVMARPAG